MKNIFLPSRYIDLLNAIKEKVSSAQIKAAIAVNSELMHLYWEIGSEIIQKQKEEGWGSKVIETLAKDLKSAFPKMSGFSPRNILYMKQFAEAYPDMAISQQVAAKLPWGHNMVLIDKLDNLDQWIDSDLYNRQGKAITNFTHTLPVEYTLCDSRRPIGVSSYTTQIEAVLSQELKANLPTIEQLESELAKKR